MHMSGPLPQGVAVSGQITQPFAQILTPEALAFVAKLHRQFESRRQELLARRAARQKEFDAGRFPDFLPMTETGASRSPARPTARWSSTR
jgi:malate synthase